jgi:polysaccharide deacetylase 2 family uncharacterized protein YibQ
MPDAIGPVLREVGERGLLFMNDGTAGGAGLAPRPRLRHALCDRPCRSRRNAGSVGNQERLKELEKIAEANGYAIGSGSAFEVTVDAVASWANGAKKRGFEIVGVSALAR